MDEGHQNDAEYCLEQMNSVASWTPECLYIQARIRQSAGDTAGAARNYETALAMDPDHALSSLHLGKQLVLQFATYKDSCMASS